MVGLAAQPENVLVVPPSERVAAKPAIREYDPHVGYPPSTKQWYTLVRLDEYGPGASDAELRELEERILSEPDDTSDDDALETLSGASANDEALIEDVQPERAPHPQHQAAYVKPGGPCDHCGAADSPQWRRGPASKPMLCNACGTRYRRTNTLGPSTPVHRAGAVVAPKKRSPPESPSSLNPAKKRCADEGLGDPFGRVGTGVRA